MVIDVWPHLDTTTRELIRVVVTRNLQARQRAALWWNLELESFRWRGMKLPRLHHLRRAAARLAR